MAAPEGDRLVEGAVEAPQARGGAQAIAALRAWLGAPAPLAPGLPCVWGVHQWVIGHRLSAPGFDVVEGSAAAAAPPPYEWLAVSSAALQSPGLSIGSSAAKSVYKQRCRRLIAAFREAGHADPAPCALLPACPPALVDEWVDEGRELCLALVRPAADLRVAGGKGCSRAVCVGSGHGDVARAVGRTASATLRAWLDLRGLSGSRKRKGSPVAASSEDDDSDSGGSSLSSEGGGGAGQPPAQAPLATEAVGAGSDAADCGIVSI